MTSKTTNKFSPEVRERAVRLVMDHEGDSPRVGRPGVDPFPWTVDGLSGSSQLMMLPFVFDRREIAQRRMAA